MERSCGRTEELAERRPRHVHAVLEGTSREGVHAKERLVIKQVRSETLLLGRNGGLSASDGDKPAPGEAAVIRMRDHDAGAGEAAPGTFVISQRGVIDPAVGVESQAGIAVELVRGDVRNDLAPVLPAIEGYRGCRDDALHEGGTVEVELVGVITADRVAWIVRIDGNRSFVVRRFRVAVQQHVAAVNCRLV